MALFNILNLIWNHPLNRGNRLKAISRFIRWQIASILLPEFVFSMPFVSNTRLLISKGMTGATGNWYCGIHELNEMGFVLHVLNEGDVFVDVGANIGSYTILAGGAIGAEVIAIEPIPDTFKHLKENINLNQLTGCVKPYCIGVSDKPGTLMFTSYLDTVNHVVSSYEHGDLISIPVTTLDDLLQGTSPTIIKIDVEGHEVAVLEGSRKTLSNPSVIAILLETNGSGGRYGINDSSIFNIMNENNFEACGYDALKRQVLPYVEGQLNTIFVRNKTEILRRIPLSQVDLYYQK